MTYENAPATRILASHCAACGRALVDAQSVETGMGPVCRKRYGAWAHLTESARSEVNATVYRIALEQQATWEDVERLRALGATAIAHKIERFRRLQPPRIQTAAIRVEQRGSCLLIKTPFDPRFVEAIKALPLSDRRWRQDLRGWLVSSQQKRAIWEAIKRTFPGAVLESEKGTTIVPKEGTCCGTNE